MSEAEVVRRWEAERPVYEAWGRMVADTVRAAIAPAIVPVALEYFLKIPVFPRLKDTSSLVDKALFRGKEYANPYEDITDKVGVRFVVLLISDVQKVSALIQACELWNWSKDRDFEREAEEKPDQFLYQSNHYIVRPKSSVTFEGVTIPPDAACEIQIRTLLQHAHSELTHDRLFKGRTGVAPQLRRKVARSIALIETADEFFAEVALALDADREKLSAVLQALAALYERYVGQEAELSKSNSLIVLALRPELGDGDAEAIEKFLIDKPFVQAAIARRAVDQHLFRQAAAPLIYYLAETAAAALKGNWPLTDDELRPVFDDLGMAFDSY